MMYVIRIGQDPPRREVATGYYLPRTERTAGKDRERNQGIKAYNAAQLDAYLDQE